MQEWKQINSTGRTCCRFQSIFIFYINDSLSRLKVQLFHLLWAWRVSFRALNEYFLIVTVFHFFCSTNIFENGKHPLDKHSPHCHPCHGDKVWSYLHLSEWRKYFLLLPRVREDDIHRQETFIWYNFQEECSKSLPFIFHFDLKCHVRSQVENCEIPTRVSGEFGNLTLWYPLLTVPMFWLASSNKSQPKDVKSCQKDVKI